MAEELKNPEPEKHETRFCSRAFLRFLFDLKKRNVVIENEIAKATLFKNYPNRAFLLKIKELLLSPKQRELVEYFIVELQVGVGSARLLKNNGGINEDAIESEKKALAKAAAALKSAQKKFRKILAKLPRNSPGVKSGGEEIDSQSRSQISESPRPAAGRS